MMCTMALAYAKSMMTKNDTVAEVEKVLLDECSHLAGSLGAQVCCVSFLYVQFSCLYYSLTWYRHVIGTA